MNAERRKRLELIAARAADAQRKLDAATDEARIAFGNIKDEVEEIRDEEQEAYDNMPESFQNGDRGEKAQEAINALDEVLSKLDDLDGDLGGVEEKASEIPVDLDSAAE